jgi:hypothetical protein
MSIRRLTQSNTASKRIATRQISSKNVASKTLQSDIFSKVLVSSDGAPYVVVWPWSDAGGFGTKFSDPPSNVTVAGFVAKFNQPMSAVGLAINSTAIATAWRWSESGFGTRYSNPTIPASSGAQGRGLDFNPSNQSVIVGTNGTTRTVLAYPWSDATGFGTRYADPSVLPATGVITRSIFNKEGTVALTSSRATSGPRTDAYAWSDSTGFGTKFADPTTAIDDRAQNLNFNSAGNVIAYARDGSPFYALYQWDDTTGFGTRFANPSTLPTTTSGTWVCFNSDDSVALTLVEDITLERQPALHAYAWDNTTGFGTKYANPTVNPGRATRYGGAFAPSDEAFVVAGRFGSSTPTVDAYGWNNTTGFGTKYANPTPILSAASSSNVVFRK